MIATPQDVTEYQEVVMSCIYKKKYFGVTDKERFLLLLHQMSSGYMQNLAWEFNQENKKEGKKLMYHLQKLFLEKPDSILCICSLICLCIFMALLGL